MPTSRDRELKRKRQQSNTDAGPPAPGPGQNQILRITPLMKRDVDMIRRDLVRDEKRLGLPPGTLTTFEERPIKTKGRKR